MIAGAGYRFVLILIGLNSNPLRKPAGSIQEEVGDFARDEVSLLRSVASTA